MEIIPRKGTLPQQSCHRSASFSISETGRFLQVSHLNGFSAAPKYNHLMCPWGDLSSFSTNFLIKAQILREQHLNLISDCLMQRPVQPVLHGSQGPHPVKENTPHVSSGRTWWGMLLPWKKAEARKIYGVICSFHVDCNPENFCSPKRRKGGEKVFLIHGQLCDGMDMGCSMHLLRMKGKKRSTLWAPISLPEQGLYGDNILPWLLLPDPAVQSRNSPLSCLSHCSAALSCGWHDL